MPFNLLLLPLLGGYMLLSQWYPTRYVLLRSQGYRLLLYSSAAGILLLFSASVVCSLWAAVHSDSYATVRMMWHHIVPVDHSGKAAIAFGCGLLGPLLLNMKASRERAVIKAIQHKSDPLELLLHRAFEEEKMVVIAMKSGRVVVGNLIRPPNPALETASVSLLPQLAGYNDEVTRDNVFTTDYRPVYRAVREEIERAMTESWSELGDVVIKGKQWRQDVMQWLEEHRTTIEGVDDFGDFELVVLLREIESVHVFDPERRGRKEGEEREGPEEL